MCLFASFLHYITRVLWATFSYFPFQHENQQITRWANEHIGSYYHQKKEKEIKIQETKHEYLIYLNRIRDAFTKCLGNAKLKNTVYFNSLPAPLVKVCRSSQFCS